MFACIALRAGMAKRLARGSQSALDIMMEPGKKF
jgi:hypothetical protein